MGRPQLGWPLSRQRLAPWAWQKNHRWSILERGKLCSYATQRTWDKITSIYIQKVCTKFRYVHCCCLPLSTYMIIGITTILASMFPGLLLILLASSLILVLMKLSWIVTGMNVSVIVIILHTYCCAIGTHIHFNNIHSHSNLFHIHFCHMTHFIDNVWIC